MRGAKGQSPLSQQELLLRVGEGLKRQAIEPNINGYRPHEKQVDFHSSPAKTRLYLGGNRSGKSYGNVAECVYWLRKTHPYRRIPVGDYEPCRGRINTVDFINGADKILLPLFKRLVPPSLLINGSWDDSYHRASRVLTLSNDSFLEFLSYESDLDKFAGTSRHFVSYDEEPPEAIYTENRARLIDTGGHQWFSLTPVEGMSWIYDKIYVPGKTGSDASIHITEIEITENPYINPDEIEQFLRDIDDENEREARRTGRFIEMGGLIYKRFRSAVGDGYVLDIERMKPPVGVPVGVSLDHGYNNPTAVLWHAMLPEGKILTFHEHYLSGEPVSYHAKQINSYNRALGISPVIWVADPSIKNTDPITLTSIHQEYAKYGIPWTLGNNDVKAGIERVNSYLKFRRNGPMWQVTKDCPRTIGEMARYKWKTYKSKKLDKEYNLFEEPHKKNDHACDSLRYFLMSRPNLEDVYADENYRTPMTTIFPDAVRSSDAEWTTREISRMEMERVLSAEYVRGGEYDMLGGIW